MAVRSAGAFEDGRPLGEWLFQDELEQTFHLAISFGGHEWSAKLVCRKSGTRGCIGHGYGAKAELGADGGTIDGGGGECVGIEEREGLCQEVRVVGKVCAEERFALFWGIVQGEPESGFDLLVAIWGHGFTRKAGPMVRPRRLRLSAGTFLQFLVTKKRVFPGEKASSIFRAFCCELVMQPGAGHSPFTFDGGRGDPHDFGGFFDCETAEETEFD